MKRRSSRRSRRKLPDRSLQVVGGMTLLVGASLLALIVATMLWPISLRQSVDAFRMSAARCASRGAAAVYEEGHCYPTDAAACVAAGGLWGFLGPTTGAGCTASAPDGGTRCRSGSDCASGHCLAIVTPSLLQQLASSSVSVAADGLCAGLLRVRGCNAELNDGLAARVICRT